MLIVGIEPYHPPPMNFAKLWRVALLATHLGLALLVSAQPILIQPGIGPGSQSLAGNGFTNLRVTHQSDDGSEATLTMDYTYDGNNGPTVRIMPVIIDRKQKDALEMVPARIPS